MQDEEYTFKEVLRVESELPGIIITPEFHEFNYEATPSILKMSDGLINGLIERSVLDLSGITYLDSAALGLLLALNRELIAFGRTLVLVPSEEVKNILSLTRLEHVFATATNIEDAILEYARTRARCIAGSTYISELLDTKEYNISVDRGNHINV